MKPRLSDKKSCDQVDRGVFASEKLGGCGSFGTAEVGSRIAKYDFTSSEMPESSGVCLTRDMKQPPVCKASIA